MVRGCVWCDGCDGVLTVIVIERESLNRGRECKVPLSCCLVLRPQKVYMLVMKREV